MGEHPSAHTIDTVVNGRYLLKRRLGSGASGEVFLAADGISHQEIAIKFLAHRSYAAAIEHFKSEFATLTKLRHPYITRVFDFAYDEASHCYFFTSEYVPGDDVLSIMQEHAVEDTIPLLVQMLQALEYLHKNHVYHFDIKPKNILVALSAHSENLSQATVKMIDFGLASAQYANRLVGTPSYIAPEMVLRESPDHRADLYSLGVLLYVAFTGVNPFRGDTRESTFKRHVTHVPPPPSSINPLIPDFFDAIIMRLIEKKREARYYSATHVLADLAQHLPNADDATSLQPAPLQPWEVRFVGRKSLLDKATHAVDTCVRGAPERPPLLWICGAPGSGKTRLLQEIKYVAQLRGFSTHAFDRVDITARMAWLAAVDAASDQPHMPIAFFLDDVTTLACEETTCDIVDGMWELVRALRAALHMSSPAHPIRTLVVMSAPHTAAARTLLNHQLPASLQNACTFAVENFSRPELQEYLGALLDPAHASALTDNVFAHTQGNPMQVTRHIAQMAASPTFTISTAPTVLPPSEQDVAQMLAVWATPATLDQLTATVERPVERTVLHSMVDQGLLQYDPIHRDYRFRNRSVQLQYTAQVPEDERARLHDRIAAIILKAPHAALAEYFQHRLHGASAHATDCALWCLAHAYTERGAHRAAVQTWHELLRITPLIPETDCWIDAHLLMADAHCQMHDFQEALRIYHFLRTALQQHPAQQRRFLHVLESLGTAALAYRLFPEAESAFSEALAIATEHSLEPSDELRFENWLAVLAMERGEIDQAIQTFALTAQATTHLSEEDQRQLHNNHLGEAYLRAHRLEDADRQLTEEIRAMETYQLPRQILSRTFARIRVQQLRGEFAQAITQYKELLSSAAHLQDAEYLVQIYREMGTCHSAEHRLDDAIQCYQTAAQHAKRLGNPWLQVDVAMLIGNIHRRRNALAEAETIFLHTLAQLETITTDPAYAAPRLCTVHYQLGTIYLRANDHARAEFHLSKAKALARQHPQGQEQICRIALALAETLHRSGDQVRYKTALAEAKSLLAAQSPDHMDEMLGFLTIHEKQ